MKLKKHQKAFLPVFLLVFFILPSTTWAATFTVTNVSQFQDALDAASDNGANDTIIVVAGTYNVATTLTYTSAENFSLTIEGEGIGSTILDGGDTTQNLYIRTTGPDDDVTITIGNITFQNGSAPAPGNGGGLRVEVGSANITIEDSEFNNNFAEGEPGPDDTINGGMGGGVSAGCSDGSIILRGNTLSDNSATNVGGGVALWTDSGTITITDSSFSDNTITTHGAGLPCCDGGGVSAQTINGEITLSGNDFTSNSSGDDGGGAFTYATGAGAIIRVTDGNTFTNNESPLGGGGFYSRLTAEGTLTVMNNTFTENRAGEGGGGGAHVEVAAGSASIVDNIFNRNEALGPYGDGGGIWIDAAGAALTITGSIFTENSASQNGGGANLFSDAGSIDLANNRFDRNTAVNVGGGISIATATGELIFRNDTIYGNSAADGGGISFYSDHPHAPTLNIFNDIIWNNTPQGILALDSGTVDVTYSDIQDGLPGVGNINTDPFFVDVADGDYHLRGSSACIGAGTTVGAPATDLEGNPRPNPPGSNPDMGAYENIGLTAEVQWAVTYGGGDWEEARSIQQTIDGGYIVAGRTLSFGAGSFAIWVLKLSHDGTIDWQNTYGGSNNEEAYCIQQTSDGGYIVAGQAYSLVTRSCDFWVLKLNSDGSVAWEYTYGGSNHDYASSIQQTSDGGYIVAGPGDSIATGSFDLWVLKLNSEGTVVWEKTYGGKRSEERFSIQQTRDGGYIVTGPSTSFGSGRGDFRVLKLNSKGKVGMIKTGTWQKTYNDGLKGLNVASSIRQTTDGGYILAGRTVPFGAGDSDIWVLKLNQDGNIAWKKAYGGSNDEDALSIQQTTDGGYIVAGLTHSFGAGGSDIWVLKLDPDGTIAWEKTYGESNGESASSIQQTSDGGYIVAGRTRSFGAGSSDILVMKLNADGEIPDCRFMGTSEATVSGRIIAFRDTRAAIRDLSTTISDTGVAPEETEAETSVICPGEFSM